MIYHFEEGTALADKSLTVSFEDNTVKAFGHSSGDTFCGMTGKQYAEFLKGLPDWKDGMRVEFYGCRAGYGEGSVAYQAAMHLPGSVVGGPTERIWALSSEYSMHQSFAVQWEGPTYAWPDRSIEAPWKYWLRAK